MESNSSGFEVRCSVCSATITSSRARRKLGSQATRRIIPFMQGLLSRRFPGSEMVVQESTSYICQPCFRRLQAVIKMRCQLVERECKIMDDLERCVSCGVISLSESETATSSTLGTPTRHRRRGISASPLTTMTPPRQPSSSMGSRPPSLVRGKQSSE